jgi:outer membrane protein OmpA-like peptidoglycan-associated protein
VALIERRPGEPGFPADNLALSLARAEAVRTLLKQRGVDPNLLAERSAGTLEPREQRSLAANRSINRRVSFTVGFDE